MKQGLILYQSKYGATKTYAHWLKDMTDYDLAETPKTAPDAAAQYEGIVLCGGVYASGIAGLSFLKRNIRRFKAGKIAVLAVGASPYEEKALRELRARSFTGDLKEVPLFYGRGAWDESKMKFTDRTLCKMLQKSVAKKDPDSCEPWMKALMCAAGQVCDWTDKKYLLPLLDYLKEPSPACGTSD